MQPRIEEAIQRMAKDIYDPALKTHHLSGKLAGLMACSCSYDCRIVFAKVKQPGSREESLLLVNLGSHDEVY
jgi:mRNA-degrading endonuclease YafQ of YafQ-DinJ toxin-antitoxin module